MLITPTSSFMLYLGKHNPMKHLSLLLTAALSLAAASAYAQAAKSSPATGASASPSTPPTIASAIDREISVVEKEVVEAAEAMPEDKFDFSPEKLNLSGSEYKGVRTFAQQVKTRCRLQLPDLVTDNRRETTGHGQRRQRPGQHESQGRNH